MAANNARPANSSDSENEWTFIDSYDGTIETKNDCVTYRKPTYSEAVRGVSEEELAEVESEPEFEVLASFQFRSKGESFGIGSSAPRIKESPKLSREATSHKEPQDDKSDGCSDDGILIISSQNEPEKSVCSEGSKHDGSDDELTANKSENYSSGTDDAIVVVDEGYSYNGRLDDDDDDMIEFRDSYIEDDWVKTKIDDDDKMIDLDDSVEDDWAKTVLGDDYDDGNDGMVDLDDSIEEDWAKTVLGDDYEDDNDEAVSTSFIDTSLNNICIYDDDDDEAVNTSFIDTSLNNICLFDDDDDDKTDDPVEPEVEPGCRSPASKWLLCFDALESSKDLAWDNLTFNLTNTMPLMMISTNSVENPQSSIHQKQDSDEFDCNSNSDSSFEPISSSDSEGTSSYDNVDDLSDCGRSTLLIPKWFFRPNAEILSIDDSNDDSSFDLVDEKIVIPDWLYDKCDESCKQLELNDKELTEHIIPDWFYDPNHNSCEDWEEICEPTIPAWFYDPSHSAHDKTFDESKYGDYSDWDSEYTDDSDSDYDDDDASSVAIPEWLFSDKKDSRQHQDDDSFLFSHLFVDVPTFIILLFLTTALGFSIGHGLTVYLSSQALNRNTKVSGSASQSNSFSNHLDQRLLTAEEIAKVDLLRLEDEIYRQKETELLSSHLRYDLKNIHKTLQEKHNRLLSTYKSTEDRLHMTKSMSWFWRLKYDQEKRLKQNSSSVIYLQRQLEKIGALYKKEKKMANKWRRFAKTRFTDKKNESIGLNKLDLLKGKLYRNKASLASKYWVQAILSSREIDWDGFKKRWTQDVKKLKDESCAANKSSGLKHKPSQKDPFGMNKNKRFCKKGNNLDQQNVTNMKSIASLNVDRKRFKNILRQVFGPTAPAGPPVGPPKKVKRHQKLMFGHINIERQSRKGETARRRREAIRNKRLKKREARQKALTIERQVKELKNVIAELRKERRKAEKEKFQLEASWRKLKRQRETFEHEKKHQNKTEKKELKDIKSKLKKTRTRLITWKNVATQFKSKAANLQRGMRNISHANKAAKDMKNIKRNLKIEKRKLREQRQDLKKMKNRLRQEHRNYAREGWKLMQKQKKLDKMHEPENSIETTRKKCRKQSTKQSKTARIRPGAREKSEKSAKKCVKQSTKQSRILRKRMDKREKRKEAANKYKRQSKKQRNTQHRPGRKEKRKKKAFFKSKKSTKNKKARWKHKETFIKYWESLEKTLKEMTLKNLNKTLKKKSQGTIKNLWKKLQVKFGNLKHLEKSVKEWTQHMNKTLKEKSRRKIKKVWKKLQEKFGSLINLNWSKQKNRKPPFHAKKKRKRKKESKSKASLIYERVLAEQLEFDRRKQKDLDESRKQMMSKSPEIIPKKKQKRKKDPDAVVKQRRIRQRRKYQRELERLKQWALQMHEEKIEHERIYKDKDEKKTKCTRLKSKPNKKKIEEGEEVLYPEGDVDADDSSNLTNTLMLLIQPRFGDYHYESFTKLDPGQTPLENKESIIRDITMAQLQHESKKKESTGLSILLDDERVLSPSTNMPSSRQEKYSDKDSAELKSNRPTPPLLDPSMYNKFPLLGIIDSHKGGSIGLPIPPPTLDSLKDQNSGAKQNVQPVRSWYQQKTRDTWTPPPGPLQSDGSWFFQRSDDRAEQRQGPLAEESTETQNYFRTEFINSGKNNANNNGRWMFARASGRAQQRILYEPLNKLSVKERPRGPSKKTHFHRYRKKNEDGSWVFQRASDREEQRSNKDPWYVRRAEGREHEREEDQNSWFVERGFERELQRHEDAGTYRDGYQDDYDDDYDDDDEYYYDIDFGQDEYDDITAA